MTNTKLKYHNSIIDVLTPPGKCLGVLEGKIIPSLDNPEMAIIESMDNPVDSPPLSAMIPSEGKISILVSDRTRNTRLDILLPTILSYLKKHGIDETRISIMVCLGTHKCHTPEGLVKHVGKKIIDTCRVRESNHEEDYEYTYVGTTQRGTKVRFRKQVLDSSLLISTGGITFHYFAGYSGGRKSFIPGIASNDTIQQNHSMTYIEGPDGQLARNPACTSGMLDGNPVSEDMEDAIRLMPVPSFLLNVIVNPQGEIAGVYSGNVIKAHRKGAADFMKLFSIPITNQADLVLASAGGYPSDINLLQSHKSIINASMAVKKGGIIVIFARCIEGLNLGIYPDFVRQHGHANLIRELHRNYAIVGGTTDNLMTLAKAFKIFLVSGLEDYEVINFGMTPFDPSRESWGKVYEGLGDDATYYVMPNASKFLPIPAE